MTEILCIIGLTICGNVMIFSILTEILIIRKLLRRNKMHGYRYYNMKRLFELSLK